MKGNTMVGKVTPNDQLSASEVPVLMGASRFMTVNELLKQKMDVI
jgi:predicted phage-related endonuclease